MMRGLENLVHEEMLKELGLSSPLFSQRCWAQTRGNEHKLLLGNFCLD